MALKPPYQKTVWKNREVERPRTYILQDNGDGTHTLVPAEGAIIEPGTPITAQNMNNIEDGIEVLDNTLNSHLAESAKKHITESGSNANGYYIKFDDGTMICVNRKVIRGSDFVELNGNTNVSGIRLSRLASQPYPATFAECFYSDFRVLGSTSVAMRSNVIGTKVEYAIDSLSNSNTQWRNPAIFHISESIDSSDETLFAFIAIGRWK